MFLFSNNARSELSSLLDENKNEQQTPFNPNCHMHVLVNAFNSFECGLADRVLRVLQACNHVVDPLVRTDLCLAELFDSFVHELNDLKADVLKRPQKRSF